MADGDDDVDATMLGKSQNGLDAGHCGDHCELRAEPQGGCRQEDVLARGPRVDQRSELSYAPHLG